MILNHPKVYHKKVCRHVPPPRLRHPMSVTAEQVLLEVPQLQDGARVVNEVWWVSEKLMVCFAL